MLQHANDVFESNNFLGDVAVGGLQHRMGRDKCCFFEQGNIATINKIHCLFWGKLTGLLLCNHQIIDVGTLLEAMGEGGDSFFCHHAIFCHNMQNFVSTGKRFCPTVNAHGIFT